MSFSLAGCGIGVRGQVPPPTIQNQTSIESVDGVVEFSLSAQNISLSGVYPAGWESFTTDYGIVLAEELGSVATDGRLNGMLVHVFVPPMDDFKLPTSSENRAWYILHEIIKNPEYVGEAAISEPIAFRWGEYEAAYYLMDSGEGHLTIVVGVVVPDVNQLVVCHTSAPADQAQRIRDNLPDLLDGFVINDIRLDGTLLDAALPSELSFPRYP